MPKVYRKQREKPMTDQTIQTDQSTLKAGDALFQTPAVNPSETPIFDMDNLSFGDVKRMYGIQDRIVAAKGEAELNQAFGEAQALMAQVVISVPRSWVVKSAPENIDWSKPESFDFLKALKFNALTLALFDSMNTDKASKN